MKEALKEIESLFGTEAKGNTVYFNDINYTPIPLPVANAVKAIMEEHPDVGYQLGLYSVKLFDKNVRPATGTITLQNGLKKKITSKKETEVKSSAIGDIKDDYCLGKIKDNEAIERLTENGKGKRDAKKILDKWKGEGVVKSSRRLPLTSSNELTYCGFPIDRSTPWVIFKMDLTNFQMSVYGCYSTEEEAFKAYKDNNLGKTDGKVIYEIDDARNSEKKNDKDSGYYELQVSNRKPIKSNLSDFFPVSEEEAKDIDELSDTFPDRSELRSVLEDYFHIYDDFRTLDVDDFDRCLSEYYESITG
jgi:hypothetical protein